MCDNCGCSAPQGAKNSDGHSHSHSHGPGEEHTHPHTHDHGHEHGHDHAHSHEHPHTHEHDHAHPEPRRVVEVEAPILDQNDRLAERNRGFFQAKKLFVLNVLSSPGSGKTTFVQKTATALRGRLRVGVVVGDLATDNDAARLREAGVPVVQITTGTACHLEAEMVAEAMAKLDLDNLDVLVIENVGNLVCPASFDLGEHLRVVLLSVTEGEDKPMKYPPMFFAADVVVVSKMDLAAAVEYPREKALEILSHASPKAKVFELSAKTGAGLDAWLDFLAQQRAKLG